MSRDYRLYLDDVRESCELDRENQDPLGGND